MRIQFALKLLSVAATIQLSLAQAIPTPLELNGYSRLSSHAEMMAYLGRLDAASSTLQMSAIGESVEGRKIPALFFSMDMPFRTEASTKPLVLIYCQQHGNEPSGKEAALVVARTLAMADRGILEALDLILVPQVNPDGLKPGSGETPATWI